MYLIFKRIFDIIISLIALSILSIPLIFISIFIIIDTGYPIFFLQERIGLGWRQFKIIKFRTMIKNADKIGPGLSLINDKRVTSVGKILRRFKIDELPQLVNVLLGDMSLIGPRPELKKFAIHYHKEYTEILSIKPGITDFASLEFINESLLLDDKPETEKFYINEILPKKIFLCKKYLAEMNLLTDLKIIFKTACGLISCK